MPHRLNGALEAFARQARADAVVVWKQAPTTAHALVLAAWPYHLAPVGGSLPLLGPPVKTPVFERDPARLARILPPSLRLRLPEAPTAALLADLDGEGLGVLLARCSTPAPDPVDQGLLPGLLAELAPVAARWDRELELATRAAQLSAAVNAFDQAVVTLDEQRLVGHANRAAARLLGVPEGPVPTARLGEALEALGRRASNQEAVKAVAARLVADRRAAVKDVVWTFDREPLHLRVATSPFDAHGVAGRVWVFDYVPELQGALEAAQRAQAAQAASDEHYRVLAENASDVVFRGSNEGVLQWISPSVASLVGWLPEDMIGRPFAEFIEPEDLPTVRAAQAGLLVGKSAVFEIRIRPRSGPARWVSVSARPLFDAAGAVVGRIGGWRDIQSVVEARQRAHEAIRELKRSETRLRLAAEAAELGIWRWNLADGRLEWDERECQMFAVPEDVARSGVFYDFWRSRVHPDDLRGIESELQRSLASGVPDIQEFRIVLPDGAIRHIQAAYVVERDDGGKPVGLLGFNRDITALKLREQELQAARQAAESANQAKSDFLANISHEIRTPMNAILGAALLLARSALPPEQARYVATIRAAGRSMMALIDDVLDLSKIEAGRLELIESPFVLGDIVSGVIDVFAAGAASKGLALELEPLPENLPTLLGDGTRLAEVLCNLIANAIKFTARGEVRVSVTEQARTADRLSLRFAVRDSGTGIAPETSNRLFTAFTQADASIHRQYGGTGLGLAISKQLVTLMGGEIGVLSEPGVGSEFWFVVPFRTTALLVADALPADATGARQRLSGVRLLVVDDSEANRDTVVELLRLEGARCETGENGARAVERLRAGPRDFDAVLMDVQMPVMDGTEATRAIRGELQLADLPIIAFSAGALPSQQRRALDAGMNDFLTKPVDLDAVIAALLRQFGPAEQARSPAPPAAAERPVESFPPLPGVDVVDAAHRLQGDRALFHTVLRALRDEFVDAAQRTRAELERGDVAAALARVHKLAGVAANASAKTVAALALDIEARLEAGERELGPRLEDLRHALGEVLAGLPADIDGAGAGAADPSIDPAEIAALKQSLAQSNARALKQFRDLRPRLTTRYGADAVAPVSRAVEQMRFGEALERLKDWYA